MSTGSLVPEKPQVSEEDFSYFKTGVEDSLKKLGSLQVLLTHLQTVLKRDSESLLFRHARMTEEAFEDSIKRIHREQLELKGRMLDILARL